MRNKVMIMMSTLFLVGVTVNMISEGRNFTTLLANVEALADNIENELAIIAAACPVNGGQITPGRPYSKQWQETHTTDREGKVTLNGQTLDFGASKKRTEVNVYAYSTECENIGDKRCVMCNVWYGK